MDKDSQTSFIPKKPLVERRIPSKRPIGIISLLATVIFFASLIAGGGLYLYRNNLVQQVQDKSVSLERAKEAFEPSLILTLQTLDKRINASREILSEHIIISPIFKALQETTLKTVRFTKFDYSINQEKIVNVNMSGEARSYRTLALQSDVFGESKLIKNPIFSNLSLSTTGDIVFDLSFDVDRSLIMYENVFNTITNNL